MIVKKHFLKRVKQMEFSFSLLQENSKETLKIQMINLETWDVHNLTVDEDYISKMKINFSLLLKYPRDFYELFNINMNQIGFESEGSVKLKVSIKFVGRSQQQNYYFHLVKKEISETERLALQFHKFKAQSTQAENKFSKEYIHINKYIRALLVVIVLLTIGLLASFLFTNNVSNKNYLLKEEIAQIVKENKEIKQRIVSLQGSLTNLQIWRVNEFINMKQIFNHMNQRKSWAQRLVMHPQNNHQQSFQIEEGFDEIIIKKQDKDSWRSYITAEQLTPGKIHFFTFNLSRSKNREIIVGVCSQKSFGQQTVYKHNQSLGYYFYNDKIIPEGAVQPINNSSKNVTVVSMEVDLNLFIVRWFAGDQMIANASLPMSMRTNELFMAIHMYRSEDEVILI